MTVLLGDAQIGRLYVGRLGLPYFPKGVGYKILWSKKLKISYTD